jgi:RES domain-containing protein
LTLFWRIASERYNPLDGEGAKKWGGRWNSAGRALVYASTSPALAALEQLVWIEPDDIPAGLMLYSIEAPHDISVQRVDESALAANWREPGCPSCIATGDEWIDHAATAVLYVPSAILPEEMNALINPAHPHASRLRVRSQRQFGFDSRLL